MHLHTLICRRMLRVLMENRNFVLLSSYICTEISGTIVECYQISFSAVQLKMG